MIGKKNDGGFTLIEVIVSVVVLGILSVSIFLIFGLMFSKFRDKNLESQMMIEVQTLNSSLQDSLKGCSYYKADGNCVEIKLTKGDSDYWYYYIVNEGKAYVLAFADRQDISTITYDSGDFIARFIYSINFSPGEFDATKNHESYLISYNITALEGDISYSMDDIVEIRSGH